MLVSAILMEANFLMNGSIEVEQTAVVWGPAIAYIVSRTLVKMMAK
ncbi:hypothetical protein LCGC14_2677680 [marine sediment metagenome]|uniref:Uncharacterized protein n=1 Tax=marine sediment metagenome TaxID=412755 RepID=A0A0F8ZMB4_9ZZZZ